MRRVLFVDQYGTLGGGQRVLMGLVRAGISRGWQVSVASPKGWVQDEASRVGAGTFGLRVPSLTDGSKTAADLVRLVLALKPGVGDLRLAIAACEPDVVHVNGARVLLQVVAASAGLPIVVHLHSAYSGKATRTLLRGACLHPRVVRVIVPSHFMFAWARDNLGISSDRLVLVENWVDDAFRAEVLSGDRPSLRLRAVALGRVAPEKGQIDVVNAVIAARMTGADIALDIAGRPTEPYHSLVVDAAAPLGAAFRSLGDVSDVRVVLSDADVCVVASKCDETFGLVSVEAMAAGVPVIAYDSGALKSIVDGAGMIVARDDVEGLTRALLSLYRDERLRRDLAQRGWIRVAERYSEKAQTADACRVLVEAMRG
ncbi:MAG: glycosyltransferase family 4 protein [Coriobacteriia bacterium]